MENLHAFTVSYLGATNNRGSRVKIKSERFNESVTIPYDYTFNSSIDIAVNHLQTLGFNLVGQAETKNTYIVLSDTFKPLK